MAERRGRYRRYDKAQKTAAVLAAESSSIVAASESTGIPETTIRSWVESPRFAELRAKTSEERAEQFRVAAQLALTRLIELIPTMDAKELIVLMGVAVDKAQLLAGKATDRVENVSITDGFDDHEKDALRDAIVAELARRTDESAAEAAVGAAEEAGADTPTG